jgi:hypothetical protein
MLSGCVCRPLTAVPCLANHRFAGMRSSVSGCGQHHMHCITRNIPLSPILNRCGRRRSN